MWLRNTKRNTEVKSEFSLMLKYTFKSVLKKNLESILFEPRHDPEEDDDHNGLDELVNKIIDRIKPYTYSIINGSLPFNPK